jgi:hypothetical protein
MIPIKKKNYSKQNYKTFHQSFLITITLSTTEHNIEPREHFVYTAMTSMVLKTGSDWPVQP